MPGGGDFASCFLTWGSEFCTEKLSPGWGFRRKKLVARGLARGGGEMVTGQIDTCITLQQNCKNAAHTKLSSKSYK